MFTKEYLEEVYKKGLTVLEKIEGIDSKKVVRETLQEIQEKLRSLEEEDHLHHSACWVESLYEELKDE